MKRSHTATLGQETLAILRAGSYEAPSGRTVHLADELRAAISGTRTYPPTARLVVPPAPPVLTVFGVGNETTLRAAGRLVAEGYRVASLNFASARNPGGGFLGGARAQEESLARASGLFPTLDGNAMYAHHRARSDPMYTTWVILSPGVPVIRDDEGRLLETPYRCAFLTSPAVNAGALRGRERRGAEIRSTMAERVERVLAVAALHGFDALVLGAWGCGVFRNDPEVVAGLFQDALQGPFRGRFSRVEFAVLDGSADRHFVGPFERAFAG